MRTPSMAQKTTDSKDNEAMEDHKSDEDSGIIVELDTTATSYSSTSSSSSSSFTSSAPSSTTTSATTTPLKVARFRDNRGSHGRLLTVFPKQPVHKNTITTVSMARKLVKKAIKIRQRMENHQNRRPRHYELLEQLCREPQSDGNNEETKKEDFEEPPPRPPTRRCMFYREDNDVVKVLRSKQI